MSDRQTQLSDWPRSFLIATAIAILLLALLYTLALDDTPIRTGTGSRHAEHGDHQATRWQPGRHRSANISISPFESRTPAQSASPSCR